MKRCTRQQIEGFVGGPENIQRTGLETKTSWWVVVLKILAYIIGLLLGGAVTTSCARAIL